MKKNLLLVLSILAINLNIQSQDYFWVGGEGNWTDVSHWATTSGGNTMHATPPGATNDVYFDENSFSEGSDEVTLDADSLMCRTLDFTGVTNDPTFGFDDFYDRLYIHGDFIVVNDMLWGFQHNHMVGSNINISTNGIWIGGTFFIEPEDENTTINVGSDLIFTNINVRKGNFKTNGYLIDSYEFRLGYTGSDNGSSTVDLGSSEIISSRFIVHPDYTTINAGTSEILVEDGPGSATVLFFGGGETFYNVAFTGVIDRVNGNNFYNELTIMPGSEVSFEDGETQTANEFVFSGTSAQPISIHSRNEGEAATLSQSSGTVNGNYLILKDNTATGGATFNASNSIDQGNVSGWDVEVTAPENYYWVGNSGDWSDLNHWAKTSGGSANHIELPSAIDDVYFDGNSFDNGTSIVNIDVELVFVDNIYTVGTAAGTTIKASNTTTNSITTYGTVQLEEDVVYNFGAIHFLSSSNEIIETNGSHWGYGSELFFEGTGTFDLADDFNGDEISIRGGKFNSNGHSITNDKFDITPLDDPIVNLDNSEIICQRWFPSTIEELSINNTKVTCSGQFYGRGHDYKKVTFSPSSGTWVYGNFFAETLELLPSAVIQILPGDTVYFENLIAEGTSDDPITIESRTEEQQAYLSKSSGIAEGEYLEIRDNHAIGGATFKANNSTLLDNVTGWNETPSAIDDEEMLFGANIFPNPTKYFLNVEFELDPQLKNENLHLYLFDAVGRRVKVVDMKASSYNKLSLDVSGFDAGIYHLNLLSTDQDKLFTRSVVVE